MFLLNLASLSVEGVSKLFRFMILPLASNGAPAGAYQHRLDLLGRRLPADRCTDLALSHLPCAIGVLMCVAGICYLTASLASAVLTPG
ncbi:hypothetical protein [Brevundimonas sp.]|uniref:hypothetical protein n=1 Tax=Brevundimonas sp. TaxID=1871086 RepID=UPI001A2FE628|nr:hypothetical protein [Brevundimonas sp.]MBJ7483871.1 hypothetical protein [Brevundimonas sp.]